MSNSDDTPFGAVVIGRNEGERLQSCLESLSAAAVTVYVDSGSTDGSVQLARESGAEVIELNLKVPFTAARARNAGLKLLCSEVSTLRYVQFVDGDCEIRADWCQRALLFLESRRDVAVVCGRRRERFPDSSVYNWLCDQEWEGPVGEVRACGGDAMMRIAAVQAVDGYREALIAGEEPELCVRLRAAGWRIWRLPNEMTWHDAAMTRFAQWSRRAMRSGYAFAQGAMLHGGRPERHWFWESIRAWIWGIWLPFLCIAVSFVYTPWGSLIWMIFPLQVLRQMLRIDGSLHQRFTLSLFQLLSRFPESWGQIKFLVDSVSGSRRRLIEYK